jgi:hypothetical protein
VPTKLAIPSERLRPLSRLRMAAAKIFQHLQSPNANLTCNATLLSTFILLFTGPGELRRVALLAGIVRNDRAATRCTQRMQT